LVASISPDVLFGADYTVEEKWSIVVMEQSVLQVEISFAMAWRDIPWTASATVRGMKKKRSFLIFSGKR
jgi:hypothetical protein